MIANRLTSTVHKPGEKWKLETQGVHVLAVYALDGFHLSVMDKAGVVKKHDEAVPDLNAATPIARALLAEHPGGDIANWKELFQTVWTRVR